MIQKESNLPEKLSKPALRALEGAAISQLEQIAKHSESEILKLHGMGRKGIEQIRIALEARGLSFADES
ncbi:DNA-directed RNA polymerase subunit alpha C-terminal domain-containing protein [Oceanobacillus arenosus]|nr:DNA-directed RNA polymerase subunit alpha C-terminal domain-containing protein [Oceanobacillus arenosus]